MKKAELKKELKLVRKQLKAEREEDSGKIIDPYLGTVEAAGTTLEDLILSIRALTNKIIIAEKVEGIYPFDLLEMLVDTVVILKSVIAEEKTPTIQELSADDIFDILANKNMDDSAGNLLDEIERRFNILSRYSESQTLRY